MSKNYDLAVIGGGPGGYVCAIRAAQLGMKVALIEKGKNFGGTCVNVGCIPSKALLDSSHKYHESREGLGEHGIQVGQVKLDLKQMMARKNKIVKELTEGLKYLIKKNNIDAYHAKASFEKADQDIIEIVLGQDGKVKEKIKSRHCVIATGSESIPLAGIETNGDSIIRSDEAIALEQVPKRLGIIGGGVIGLELGSVWQRLGAEVTIFEAMPSIFMAMDKQMRDLALRIFTKQGLKFLLAHKVKKAELTKNKKLKILAEDSKGKVSTLEVDKLLVAVGRRPYTESLGIEKIGVQLNKRGRIEVNPKTLETHAPRVYALGDVIEGAMLAHRAEEEGVMLAERIAGQAGHINYKAVPWIVYTWPEIAWVGLSEESLKAEGIEYNRGSYMFKANGRAKAMNESEGLVKIFADKHDDRILGIFIIGPNASEMIAEAALAMEFGASAEDIARSFHAHPTLAEVMKEAALDVAKRAIHA